MSSYGILAEYYDSLTENVDYQVRSDYISNFFSRYGKGKKTLLDLACGTGSISRCFSEKGFEIIGMDLSEDMLVQAGSKEIDNALFVRGDIRNFELAEKVNYCICSLDSINHLANIEEVKSCFQCVRRALNKDGVFVFDVNTLYKNASILGNNTFVYDEEGYFLCWDNEYIGDGTVNLYLDFFIDNGKSYDRFSEQFREKAYPLPILEEAVKESGFEIIGIYDELTELPAKADSQRVYFVCKGI